MKHTAKCSNEYPIMKWWHNITQLNVLMHNSMHQADQTVLNNVEFQSWFFKLLLGFILLR